MSKAVPQKTEDHAAVLTATKKVTDLRQQREEVKTRLATIARQLEAHRTAGASPAERAEAMLQGRTLLQTRRPPVDLSALEQESQLLEEDLQTLAEAIRLAEQAKSDAQTEARRLIIESYHVPGYRQLVEQLCNHLTAVLEVSEQLVQAREAAGKIVSCPERWLAAVENVVEIVPGHRATDATVPFRRLASQVLDGARKFNT
jgi:hypothetical protein